jgi:hypothetical protein
VAALIRSRLINVVAASLPATPKLCEGGCRGAPGGVDARSTGEDSKQKTTKALSSAAAKIFVLFVSFCKKSKTFRVSDHQILRSTSVKAKTIK